MTWEPGARLSGHWTWPKVDELLIPFLWVGSSELLDRHHRYQTAHGAFLKVIRTCFPGERWSVVGGGRDRRGSI